jgi:Methyltransferase domain
MSIRYLKQSVFQPSPEVAMGPREQIASDITGKYGQIGDLLDIFVQTEGEGVDKWHHYLPLYDRYFRPWRNRPLRFLEIGVYKGGSLQMWRKYFGHEAVIFGIDIDPTCARFDGEAGHVRIGSQSDPGFLNAVVDEMGGVDLVLDDGSHRMPDIEASLAALFPRLSTGGIYVIEDLHTAYWKQYGGGPKAQSNFFNSIRSMVDDMHHWYHESGVQRVATAGSLTGLHVHDSMVILEKGAMHRPVRSLVGGQVEAAAGNTSGEGRVSE